MTSRAQGLHWFKKGATQPEFIPIPVSLYNSVEDLQDVLDEAYRRPGALRCNCTPEEGTCHSRKLPGTSLKTVVRDDLRQHSRDCILGMVDRPTWLGRNNLPRHILEPEAKRTASKKQSDQVRDAGTVQPRRRARHAAPNFHDFVGAVVARAYWNAFHNENRSHMGTRRLKGVLIPTWLNQIEFGFRERRFGARSSFEVVTGITPPAQLLIGFVCTSITQPIEEANLVSGYFWSGAGFVMKYVDLVADRETMQVGSGQARVYQGESVQPPFLAVAIADSATRRLQKLWLHPVASDGYVIAPVESGLERDFALLLMESKRFFFKPMVRSHVEQLCSTANFPGWPKSHPHFRYDFIEFNGNQCFLYELIGRPSELNDPHSLAARKAELSSKLSPPWRLELRTRADVAPMTQPPVLDWHTGFRLDWNGLSAAGESFLLPNSERTDPSRSAECGGNGVVDDPPSA